VERALNLEELTSALGEHPARVTLLPSGAELQELLADAEVRLFTGRREASDDLLRVGWYLHGVASAAARFELYGRARQRRAFQISAHIFDLALLDESLTLQERLRYAFAAEVGYHRGELQPNAMAIWRRVEEHVMDGNVLDHSASLGLEAGVTLLGLDRRRAANLLRGWRASLATLRRQLEVPTLDQTMFAAPNAVADGAAAILQFLAFGNATQLNRARARLTFAAEAQESHGDLDSRWVAAHLLDIAADMVEGSVWRLLPPDLPDVARQALTLTDPPILTLWEPQRQLLRGDPSPLRPETRRVVMSVPTSAGKTLLAQLLMVSHLARGETSICYVAPMRSLGREVRRSMRARMRLLQREMGRDLPDFMSGSFNIEAALELLAELIDPPDVDIMTPERLAHALRENAESVLERYGLFVFDEAHLMGEQGRGFTLEAVLSFLHWRTRQTHHRIVLLSAAFGNRGQLMSWLDPDDEGLLFESDWRGPRRLNALFTTTINWTQEPREERVNSRELPRRQFYEQYGDITLRPAQDAAVQRLQLVQPVGEVAFRATADGIRNRHRESNHSTPMYRAVARLAVAISHGGPVMVVTTTRADARRMAQAIADLRPTTTRSQGISEFARLRLGDAHPLVAVLRRGVAFHHAALPVDVLEAIEDAVRDDQLSFITSTTSLTEGVNLPVRTVVLAETRYEGQPADAILSGARLLNAMGRAGRACKECEGWVVLVANRQVDENDFALMNVRQEELQVISRLADAAALEELAQFEDATREAEDALFALGANVAGEFAAFVWFVLAAEEAGGRDPESVSLETLFNSTLAAVQLQPRDHARWRGAAESVRDTYIRTGTAERRRWARAGTTIGTARRIAQLADELAELAANRDGIADVDVAFELLNESGAIERILDLPEAPRSWVFRRTTSGLSAQIEVAPRDLLSAWVHATPLAQLADDFLDEVPAADYRIEQMVDAVTQHFEHFLAWMLGVLLQEVNDRLVERDSDEFVCPPLPLFVRYGVDTIQAVELLTSGVRSREFAATVGETARREGIEAGDLRGWLREMTIGVWRDRFGAAAGDILDLLEYARTRRGGLLRSLLEAGEVSIEVTDEVGGGVWEDVEILAAEGVPPVPLVVRTQDGESRASVPTAVHSELQALLDTGLAFQARLDEQTLQLRLEPEDGMEDDAARLQDPEFL
jgi:hypothetical protein